MAMFVSFLSSLGSIKRSFESKVASEYGSSEGPRSGAQLSSFFKFSGARSRTIANAEAKYQAWRITVDAGEKELTTLIMHYRACSGKLKDHARSLEFVANRLIT